MKNKLIGIGLVLIFLATMVCINPSEVRAAVCSVSTVPSVSNVSAGGTFDVDVVVNTDSATRGLQFVVSWDPTLVQCTGAVSGTFYSSFASANGGDVFYLPSNNAYDNTAGRFPKNTASQTQTATAQNIAITGASGPNSTYLGPTGTGNAYILHMTALSGASGTATFTLTEVILGDNGANTQDMHPTVNNGQVTIGSSSSNNLAVTSAAATNVTTTGATLNGSLTALGGASSVNVKFEYGTSTSYGISTTAQALTAAGNFTATLTGLTAGTIYHYRADATGSSTVNGSDMTFTTGSNNLSVTSGASSNVTTTGATLNGSLTSTGGASSVNVNFEYGTTTSYGSSTTATAMTAAGNFSATLTGLSAGTTYHYRADATGSSTVNGSDMTFTTAMNNTLAVTSSPATGITTTGATLNGTLASLGGASSVNVNFEYGTSTSYGTSTTVQAMTATGNFTAALTGLTAGTTYHFRADATGSSTANGSDMTFTTAANNLSVTSSAATGITTTGAILNGNLTSLGGASSVSVSFDYGTTTGYGNSISAPAMTAAESFNAALTGLTAGTTYHFRADATTSSTVNGNDMTFTTAPLTTSTTSATSTTSTTVTAVTTTTPSTTTSNVVTTVVPTTEPTAISSGLGVSYDISGSMDESGVLQTDFEQYDIRYNAGNNIIDSLIIKNGTRVVANDGSPVESISIQPGTDVPQAAAGESIISAVQFGPSGTVFSTPMVVVFGYDRSQLPKNAKAGSLALQWYDTETSKWENCDYTVNTQNNQITANISHFSLYAITVANGTGLTGMGLSPIWIIVIAELLLGLLAIYYFVRRGKPVVPERGQAAQSIKSSEVELREPQAARGKESYEGREPSRVVNWDDILTKQTKKGEPFETHLEITGGKIVIPRDGKSTDIEITNNPETRIVITLEYDPELHPRGLAKIMVLGPASEYEKLKEIGK